MEKVRMRNLRDEEKEKPWKEVGGGGAALEGKEKRHSEIEVWLNVKID